MSTSLGAWVVVRSTAASVSRLNGRKMPKPVAHQLGKHTAAMLLKRELPEAKFIVPDYVPEGLTILAGKGKMGSHGLRSALRSRWLAAVMRSVPSRWNRAMFST
jgi:hypothetical protein